MALGLATMASSLFNSEIKLAISCLLVLLHNLNQPLHPCLKLSFTVHAGIGLIAIEVHTGNAGLFFDDISSYKDMECHQLTASVDMAKHAIAVIILDRVRSHVHDRRSRKAVCR